MAEIARFKISGRTVVCMVYENAEKLRKRPSCTISTPTVAIGKNFYDYGNLESLCKSCHDSLAQSIEKRGYSTEVGTDGWPIDPKHPQNESE